MNFAIEYRTCCDGLVLLAPGLFPSRAVRSAASAELDRIKRSSGETELLRSPITEEMFTDGPRLNDFILADELRSRHLTLPFYDLMLRMSFIAALRMPNLNRPILLLLADRDQAVDNERTMQAFKKSLAHLSCGTLDCNHGMQFEMPDELASRIANWIHKVADASAQS